MASAIKVQLATWIVLYRHFLWHLSSEKVCLNGDIYPKCMGKKSILSFTSFKNYLPSSNSQIKTKLKPKPLQKVSDGLQLIPSSNRMSRNFWECYLTRYKKLTNWLGRKINLYKLLSCIRGRCNLLSNVKSVLMNHKDKIIFQICNCLLRMSSELE